MGFCASSLLYGFFYRYYAIIGKLKFLNSWKGIILFFFIGIFLPIPSLTILIFSHGDDEENHDDILERYPGIYDVFENGACHGTKPNLLFLLYGIVLLLGVLIIIVVSIVLCVKIISTLRRLRTSLSERTYRMHRQLLLALFFQCAIPLLFLVIPICGAIILLLTNSSAIKGNFKLINTR